MVNPLDQIAALSQNPTGLPGASQTERREQELLDEIQYQQELRQQQEFAYGKALAGQGPSRSPIPEERQLHYLFDTQPKQEEVDKTAEWDETTFDETEILRHIQFGMHDRIQASHLEREYADIQIIREQYGNEDIAKNAFKRLYFRVLAEKGTIHEGHSPAIEVMLNPANRTEIKQQQIPYDSGRKPSGFFGFLKGGK